MFTPEAIVLHHSLTRDNATVSWGRIRRYHVGELGWTDIGYHFGIELARDQYEVFAGRGLDCVGAHCAASGMNRRSLGVCFVGNFDYDPPPSDQWAVGLRLVRSLCNRFDIDPDDIYGHRYFDGRKTCPGRMFDMAAFVGGVRRLQSCRR